MLDLIKPLDANYMPQNIISFNEELSTGELRAFQMTTKQKAQKNPLLFPMQANETRKLLP